VGSPRHVWRWLEAGLLLGAALFGLGFQLTVPSRHIPDADYRAAAALVARNAQPGDAVLLYPWWTERARLFLPEGLPVVGYLGSDTDDLWEHPRIWLLAAPGLPRSDLDGFLKGFGPGRAPLPLEGNAGPRTLGKLSVALYRNDRARPVRWSAVDHQAQARVYLEHPDGRREACAYDRGAFRCPRRLTVSAGWHELFYQPRRCLFMHAPGGPERLVAEFEHVPGGATLRLSGGIIWEHAWKHERSLTPYDVSLREADGAVVGSLRVPVGQEGFLHRDLPAGGEGERTLALVVQSDHFEERDGCVSLDVLGGTR
jgi:hypothetical protein